MCSHFVSGKFFTRPACGPTLVDYRYAPVYCVMSHSLQFCIDLVLLISCNKLIMIFYDFGHTHKHTRKVYCS